MKPKHHFMVHYPSIMQQIGPLWNICCMRFESKNREAKQISRSAIFRVNVYRTFALRHQLILNFIGLCVKIRCIQRTHVAGLDQSRQ